MINARDKRYPMAVGCSKGSGARGRYPIPCVVYAIRRDNLTLAVDNVDDDELTGLLFFTSEELAHDHFPDDIVKPVLAWNLVREAFARGLFYLIKGDALEYIQATDEMKEYLPPLIKGDTLEYIPAVGELLEYLPPEDGV